MLMASPPFFARKFDESVDTKTFARLEQHLLAAEAIKPLRHTTKVAADGLVVA